MSKHAEAELILRLYELRRDETMRKARDWFFLDFNPETVADFRSAMFSDKSNYMRMVMSYWDMAAALVNHGAISLELFNDTNGEHLSVFAKLEPILTEARSSFGPRLLMSLEKLVDATPDGRERLLAIRQRTKNVRARLAKQDNNGEQE